MRTKYCICGWNMVKWNGFDKSRWWVCYACGYMEARQTGLAIVLVSYAFLFLAAIGYIIFMEAIL